MLVVRDADMRFEKYSMEFDDIKSLRVSRKNSTAKKNIRVDADHLSMVQLKGVMRATGHLSPSKLCRFLASSALSGKFFA